MPNISLRFHGLSSRTSPLTWSQRYIWDYFQRMSPGVERYDLKFSHVLRAPIAVLAAERALHNLVCRHETFRTVFELGPGGVPRQRILGSGVISAEIRESPTISENAAEISGTSGWPVKLLVQTTGGLVTRIDFSASHLALDGWGAQLVLHELEGELRQPEVGVADRRARALQPADRAVAEQTEAYLSKNVEALEFWTSQLQNLPSVDVPKLARSDQDGTRYQWGQLTSGRLAGSLEMIRSAARCTASAPFLTAINSVTEQITGARKNGFRVIFHNRIDKMTAASVGCFFRETLIALADGDDLRESLRYASRGILQACSHAQSDPRAVEAMLRGARRDGYANNARIVCFNFVDHRKPDPWSRGTRTDSGTASPATFEWLPGLDRDGQMMYWNIDVRRGGVVLRLLADTEYIPPRWIKSALYECERMLDRAARDLV